MEYNTQQRRLPLPEYGRSVQNMVDHALTIEDRAERQRCANTIINIMGGMFPHLRDVPDFKHKLWDHLAIMADFKLDIDYPYEIVKKESLEMKPEVLPYPEGHIRYRHYGRILEQMVKAAVEYPDENEKEKKQFIRLVAIQMKKAYLNWNKEVDDQKILDDLREYSNGAIDLSPSDLQMYGAQQQPRPFVPRRPMQNNQRRMQNNNHNNQQRKKY